MTSSTRWIRLCKALGATQKVEASYRLIVDLYKTPIRAYHSLRHVDHCLSEFDAVRDTATDPAAIEAAIWFHDAIYDSRAQDNEERSASIAVRTLADMGIGAGLRAKVHKLIMYTRHKVRPPSMDGRIIVDVDLTSLGTSPSVFVQTAWAIRKEYAWMPEAVFWPPRAKFLRVLLARKRIFYTNYFFRKYEAQARQNMSRFITLIERDMRKKARRQD